MPETEEARWWKTWRGGLLFGVGLLLAAPMLWRVGNWIKTRPVASEDLIGACYLGAALLLLVGLSITGHALWAGFSERFGVSGEADTTAKVAALRVAWGLGLAVVAGTVTMVLACVLYVFTILLDPAKIDPGDFWSRASVCAIIAAALGAGVGQLIANASDRRPV